MIGGARFDRAKLEKFILTLARKHPAAVIFTGDGRGSEKEVLSLAKDIGLTVVRPELRSKWYGDEALICQVNDILIDSGLISPIVLVGTGARVTRAREIVDRLSTHKSRPRLVHEIARLPTKPKEPAPRRASKPVHD